jgi:hypothetical protein
MSRKNTADFGAAYMSWVQPGTTAEASQSVERRSIMERT